MKYKKLSDYDIFLRGQLIVNLPVIFIILIIGFGLSMYVDLRFKTAMIIGVVLGWIYWSFSVKKWIQWAVANDVDEERLVRIGKRGLLVWSKSTVETVTKHNRTPFI
ncbi:hypothetical protein IRZ71_12335 [Flavobacterium sp. ANB]|jgi:hypothetical protein|uniref:hypothetical protein n=1 Tax=unclassified Flavobacterium TaxID=196869 RepID=UPI0012B9104B|nr:MULTISPECIES: hypothetical protein [unclassified Flavobacterium]MBF4517142.1 hypothetical protein [Flavobacterium sp. ANB]MTD71878.1 hypothetical protein [Flavobacterium sp. LC2016-13]